MTGIKRSKLPLNPDKIIEDINLEELIQMLKRFGKGCLGLGVVAVFAISQEAVAQVANVAQASESNSAEIKKIITEEFNLTPEARIKKLSEQNEQLKA
ncbi:MAG: hypothetical protein KBC84_10945, partial [Proteobacteria bacterium]|nr:hypothetical protein [Pseudomonadota bacterium]